eukprot:scaffold1557_cov246-Pinguiococcus_pyrenoidosus.AAC.18
MVANKVSTSKLSAVHPDSVPIVEKQQRMSTAVLVNKHLQSTNGKHLPRQQRKKRCKDSSELLFTTEASSDLAGIGKSQPPQYSVAIPDGNPEPTSSPREPTRDVAPR